MSLICMNSKWTSTRDSSWLRGKRKLRSIFGDLLSSLVSDLVPDKRGQFSLEFIHTADHWAWCVDQHNHLTNDNSTDIFINEQNDLHIGRNLKIIVHMGGIVPTKVKLEKIQTDFFVKPSSRETCPCIPPQQYQAQNINSPYSIHTLLLMSGLRNKWYISTVFSCSFFFFFSPVTLTVCIIR